jgi:putative transposase
VIWRGRRYSIERREVTGDLHLRDLATDERRMVKDEALVDALFAGELEIASVVCQEAQQQLVGRRRAEDLMLLPERRREEAKRRYRYVWAVFDRGVSTLTRATLSPIIEDVARESADPNPPSWLSLYRWLRSYTEGGEDVRALIPAVTRGNRTRKFGLSKRGRRSSRDLDRAREVASIVDEVVNEAYLSKQRLSVQAVYDLLEVRIAENNRFRSPEDRLPIPHRDSLYDLIAKIDPYEKDAARYGRRYADQRWRINKRGIVVRRPLERVEIDHTQLDMFVVDEEYRLPIGRPWLTAAVDKYSRMILGYYLSFTPPSALSVMQCLLHSIKPKTYLQELYSSVENTWDAYGIPETIASDNGLEFLGDDYEDACLQLGMAIYRCPVRMPWFKAVVENYFTIQNRRLLHRMPGTTFSNIIDKGEYDSQKNAVISFKALQEMIHIWIIDIYSRSEHRGLGGIPAKVWQEGIAQFQPALPARMSELSIMLGQVERRVITSNGIELFGMHYRSDELARLRREADGEKVLVKYDANDLSLIYVADRMNLTYVPVPAEDQEYTKGLTLFQHRIIRRYCRENIKEQTDADALRRAKAKIQAIVEREWRITKRSGRRVKMARFLNVSSGDGAAELQSDDSGSPLELPGHGYGGIKLLPAVSGNSTSETDTSAGFGPEADADVFPAESLKKQSPGKRSRTKRQDKNATTLREALQDETSESAGAQASELDLSGWDVGFDLP